VSGVVHFPWFRCELEGDGGLHVLAPGLLHIFPVLWMMSYGVGNLDLLMDVVVEFMFAINVDCGIFFRISFAVMLFHSWFSVHCFEKKQDLRQVWLLLFDVLFLLGTPNFHPFLYMYVDSTPLSPFLADLITRCDGRIRDGN